MKTKLGDVPCRGCTACCHTDVVLWPAEGDVLETYEHRMIPLPATGEMVPALQRRPDGSCVYLGKRGCGIHERRPSACRTFDCRLMCWVVDLQIRGRGRRRAMVASGELNAAVAQGRRRMHTLDATFLEKLSYRTHMYTKG